MKKVLVIGNKGMLAHDLAEILGPVEAREEIEVSGADLPEVDITNEAGVRKFVAGKRPNVIINCAAYTDVDGCETKKELAYAVNGTGVGNLAKAANDAGAKLVHISTDFVFDGMKQGAYLEDDKPGPLSVYGLSKLAGEEELRAKAKDWILVRTAWLFGCAGKCFPKAIMAKAATGGPLRVVDDQRGSPTHALDLAEALWKLVEVDARGIYHGAGSGSCTWFEFAEEICRQGGYDVEVKPIGSEELGRPARRPENSVLDSSKLAEATGFEFPAWRQSLRVFLTRL